MSPSSTSTQWTTLFAVFFITFLGSIDSSYQLNCNDGFRDTLNRCRALVDSASAQRSAKFSVNEGCTMPSIPNSHVALESNRNMALVAGETVPHLSLILYECTSGYLRVGGQFNLCYNGNWLLDAHPKCIIPTHDCEISEIRKFGTEAACERDGLTVPCDEPIVPGTVARIKCRNRYKEENHVKGSDTLLCQENGKWNNEPISCKPICGELVTRSTPFVEDGKLTNITFVPWHVAIYKWESGRYNCHCGGTIISEKRVLTAASCFSKLDTEDVKDQPLYLVGAGKHLGSYDTNDPMAQFRNVSGILINPRLQTAYILLGDPLVFTTLIAPVCMSHVGLNTSQEVNLVNYGREGDSGSLTRVTSLISLSHEKMSLDCASMKLYKTCTTDRCVSALCRNFLGSGITVESTEGGISRQHLIGFANVTQTVIQISSYE